MKLHLNLWFFAFLMSLCLVSQGVAADFGGKTTDVETVLKGLETRYKAPAFSARFFQESPLPDIQITETAEGKAFFKRPGKFRWSYETPDVLEYISDGDKLWIYSPTENNVWVGTSEDFFGKSGSAGVLTDLSQLRKKFHVSLAEPTTDKAFQIKLVPKGQGQGMGHLVLFVDKRTYDILKIVSLNANGEETRISLTEMAFHHDAEDAKFSFKIPENAIIIPLK